MYLALLYSVICSWSFLVRCYLFWWTCLVCSCCASSQTGTPESVFDSEFSLCPGSQGSWVIKNAKLGGEANIFHLSWCSCVGFFLFFCHRLLGYFGKNYLNLFSPKLSALCNIVEMELIKFALFMFNYWVFGNPYVWVITWVWNVI